MVLSNVLLQLQLFVTDFKDIADMQCQDKQGLSVFKWSYFKHKDLAVAVDMFISAHRYSVWVIWKCKVWDALPSCVIGKCPEII